MPQPDPASGPLARFVAFFLRGNLPPFLALLWLLGGLLSVVLTPREEDPQIVVPMADVHVLAPGLSVQEVERQVATRLEKLMAQIQGVEHVYSMSLPGRAVVTVRFHVGENREDSLVEVYNKLLSNTDRIPPGVESWVVKPVEIDDVPIVVASLWSERPEQVDDFLLRRIAEEIEIELQALPDTNRTEVVGGRPRVVRVELDPDALAARRTSALDVAWALQVSNLRRPAGRFDRLDRSFEVETGEVFGGIDALRRAVVNVVDGLPVLLQDVARIADGPAEAEDYSWIGFGPAEAGAPSPAQLYPAVHVAVAKQRGTNAVTVAERVVRRLDELARTHLPDGVQVRITRNYGRTADEKVSSLLESLAAALVIVVALLAWALGWREALVVAVAVPLSFSLSLLINYAAGYTINRVTLFALILSLGLVVDDSIVDVENVYRHLRLRAEEPLAAVLRAVNEVRLPMLLATLAVIVAFLPMLFITGMMGPYMRPMALNVPVAMLMSALVELTVTPWVAHRALRRRARAAPGAPEAAPVEAGVLYRAYARVVRPFLGNRRRAWRLLGATALLFVGAASLAALRAVPLKMLPFDNKDELQVIVNAPEGTTLERTDAVTRALAAVLAREPDVLDFELFTGLASPMDFNGMVRHYFLRRGPELADIRVNLAPKAERSLQSHAIALRLRDPLEAVARRHGVRIAIVEVPPGPPVLATLTGVVRAEADVPHARLLEAARRVEQRLLEEPGVSDVDSSVEDEATRLVFSTDHEKAALSGVAAEDVARTLALALRGLDASQLHLPEEVNPLPIRLRLPREVRSGGEALAAVTVRGRPGIAKVRERGGVRDAPIPVVRLGELGSFRELAREQPIYHKDLERVAWVYAEPVGRAPAEVAADVAADRVEVAPAPAGERRPRTLGRRSYLSNGGGLPWALPAGTSVDWLDEGELEITRDVFRDLGIAFGAAVIGIYLILVYQTGSYAMPWILMISIPLTLLGIMPGFWLLNAVAGGRVAGYADPIFFTATAMIGMIALSGIAVRNAILLIEFVHAELKRGANLDAAILRSGAVRTRPIVLTAGTAMLAAIPIAFDPIFSGLAWALIFGLLVSTSFTLVVVPVVYDMVYRGRPGHGLPGAAEEGART